MSTSQGPAGRRSPRTRTEAPGPDVPVYVISVAAELTGLHPQTLRAYDRMGLVRPGRTGGGAARGLDQPCESFVAGRGRAGHRGRPRRIRVLADAGLTRSDGRLLTGRDLSTAFTIYD